VSEIVVKIVQAPLEPRLAHSVSFDETDAREWARFAMKHNGWQAPCVIGMPVPSRQSNFSDVEVAVAIAAPDGRVAVWYGQATTGWENNRGARRRRREVSCYEAGLSVLGCRAVAAIWDDRRRRGGARDVTPLALAACRVLHADVFGYESAPRDRLLREFAPLCGAQRPETTHLIRASDDALLAASTLLMLDNYQGACALLAGKGVYES
jgi:hypothetical protein